MVCQPWWCQQPDSGSAWNPYDFARPVVSAAYFAGREAALAEAVEYVWEGSLSREQPALLCVVGPPRSGRTSFLNMLATAVACRGARVARADSPADGRPCAVALEHLRRPSHAAEAPSVWVLDNVPSDGAHAAETLLQSLVDLPVGVLVLAGDDAALKPAAAIAESRGLMVMVSPMRPYESVADTEACIRKPLEVLPAPYSALIALLPEPATLRDVHDLSAGQPDQVRLLAHFMFGRATSGGSSRMELTHEVMAAACRAMEAIGETGTAGLRAARRGATDHRLRGLARLTVCCEATLDQIWFTQHLRATGSIWSKEALERCAAELDALGIVQLRGGSVRPSASAQKLAYWRYRGRLRGISVASGEPSYAAAVRRALRCRLTCHEQLVPLPDLSPYGPERVTGALRCLCGKGEAELLQEEPALWEALYWAVIEQSGGDWAHLVEVTVATPWFTAHEWCRPADPSASSRGIAEMLRQALRPLSLRLSRAGGALTWRVHRAGGITAEMMASLVETSGPADLLDSLAAAHEREMARAYLELQDSGAALRHASLAHRFGRTLSTAANLAYLLLVFGEASRAREILRDPALLSEGQAEGRESSSALASYDQGVAEAMLGDPCYALASFESAERLSARVGRDERYCACLLVPDAARGPGELGFREAFDVDLLAAASAAVHAARMAVALGGPAGEAAEQEIDCM